VPIIRKLRIDGKQLPEKYKKNFNDSSEGVVVGRLRAVPHFHGFSFSGVPHFSRGTARDLSGRLPYLHIRRSSYVEYVKKGKMCKHRQNAKD
jgi:hypothetical protein